MIPDRIRVEVVPALTGRAVDDAETAPRCTTCGAHFFADSRVTAYAYRFTDDPEFILARLYCEQCDQTDLQYPTLGAIEVLVRGTLRQRLGSLLLDDLSVVDYAGPTVSATR